MSKKPEWVPPQYFTGAGVFAVDPGEDKHAQPARDYLAGLGLDPMKIPWCMFEMILHCDDPVKEFPITRQSIQLEVGLSKVFCPAPEDPDLQLKGEYTTHFRIGSDVDHGIIIGVTSDKFRDAWAKYKACFFECHLWVCSWDEKVEFSEFFCTTLREPDTGVSFVVQGNRPVIAPVDKSRGYVCRYGVRNGWKL